MKILVTGATGYIGGAAARDLRLAGHDVSGLARSEAAAARIRPVIGQRYPLERAADAHRAIEARDVIGKTLLEI